MALATKPALVIVDMQNGFIHPDGFMVKVGYDITGSVKTIEPIKQVLTAARKAQIPIVFTRYSLNEDYSDAGQLRERSPQIVQNKGLIRGSWDAAIIDELAPLEGEIIIDKTRYSAFHKTDLLDQLTALGVDQIILTGVTTNVCVEGTGRDAYAHDFKVVILSDATGAVTEELHQSALGSMKYGMGPVVPTAEIVQALESRA